LEADLCVKVEDVAVKMTAEIVTESVIVTEVVVIEDMTDGTEIEVDPDPVAVAETVVVETMLFPCVNNMPVTSMVHQCAPSGKYELRIFHHVFPGKI